jgi:hypothetical protein
MAPNPLSMDCHPDDPITGIKIVDTSPMKVTKRAIGRDHDLKKNRPIRQTKSATTKPTAPKPKISCPATLPCSIDQLSCSSIGELMPPSRLATRWIASRIRKALLSGMLPSIDHIGTCYKFKLFATIRDMSMRTTCCTTAPTTPPRDPSHRTPACSGPRSSPSPCTGSSRSPCHR